MGRKPSLAGRNRPVLNYRSQTVPKAPKKKPALKAQKSLEELDAESSRLAEKLEGLLMKKETMHAEYSYDHPSVKRITKQVNFLSKKIRNVSMARYKLRNRVETALAV